MNKVVTHGIVLLIGLVLGFIASASRISQPSIIGNGSTTTVIPGSSVGQISEYCFSPEGNCDQVIIRYINQARNSIHIMIYEFRLKSIEAALVDARNRGIEIKLVMDRSQTQKSSLYSDLKQKGFDVKIANVKGIMHDKVAIIDGQYVIEGSFNYKPAAVTDNAENLVVINDVTIAQAYQNQFQQVYNQGS
jgi:phosphatidylserine/phosphatidylglycerophosphate/cardiolipin synthase-like enzyme